MVCSLAFHSFIDISMASNRLTQRCDSHLDESIASCQKHDSCEEINGPDLSIKTTGVEARLPNENQIQLGKKENLDEKANKKEIFKNGPPQHKCNFCEYAICINI